MTCLFFHLWSPWEQYEHTRHFIHTGGELVGQTFDRIEHRQRRHCQTCGYKQDREVGHY